MRRMSPFTLTPALLSLALLGCADAGPDVELVEVTPAELALSLDAENDLSILLRYSDGDGDLGGGSAEVTDCRAEGLVTTLSIPAIANEEALADGVAIDGEMVLHVNDIIEVPMTGNAHCQAHGAPALASDELSLCVTLIDAAGNRSNTDCSGIIRTQSAAP